MIISCILQQARIKNKAKIFHKLFNPLSPFVGYENQFFLQKGHLNKLFCYCKQEVMLSE